MLFINHYEDLHQLYEQQIDRYIGKEIIKVLIGQRRVGKSYLLYQTMDTIRERYSDANIIYINLEIHVFEHISTCDALYNYVKSKTVKEVPNFLMIDEIQWVPKFEKTLNSLLAEGGYDIYCTGSNAHILSGELGAYLGGRYIEIPVYSLTYPEFLNIHSLENNPDNLTKYLKYGGLPCLIHLDQSDETVFDYLKNISQSILFRDVVSRFEIRNIDFMNRLVRYLANEIGNLLSARGISKFLKSQSITISITAILNYLYYLSTAMLVAGVPRSDIQGKRVFEVGEKVYIQVALRITEKETMEREFGNLKAIKDNYPKYVVTLDDYSGSSYEGIVHLPLRKFLYEFV